MRPSNQHEINLRNLAVAVLNYRDLSAGNVRHFNTKNVELTSFPITKNGRGVTINYRPPEGRTHSVFVCHSRREGTETLLYLPGIWESDLKQLAADARPKLKAAS
jgi:hypothetical protein